MVLLGPCGVLEHRSYLETWDVRLTEPLSTLAHHIGVGRLHWSMERKIRQLERAIEQAAGTRKAWHGKRRSPPVGQRSRLSLPARKSSMPQCSARGAAASSLPVWGPSMSRYAPLLWDASPSNVMSTLNSYLHFLCHSSITLLHQFT